MYVYIGLLVAIFAIFAAGEGGEGGESSTRGEGGLDPLKPVNSCSINDVWDLDKAKEEAQQLLSLIRARYELDGPIGSNFLLTTSNMLGKTFDIMKFKFLKKMLEENKEDKTFLMTFGGSSVTAGHDSKFEQSYPQIVQKRMGPILATLGVDLQVHNIALGANNCSPYQFCYEAQGGHDPDWVGWEQSYNCGHDEAIFELAARVGGFSKNKAVVYYSASGAWSPSGCPDSEDKPPFSAEEWKPSDAGIEEWKPEQEDVQKWKDSLHAYASASQSARRFHTYDDGSHNYAATSPHGFNVWEPNALCKGRNKEDTADVTNCNGIDSAQGCKLRFMSHEASIYGSDDGGGANWHPTRAFHMLRGEFISWLYTLALLDGIIEVNSKVTSLGVPAGTALSTSQRKNLYDEYTTKLAELQPPLPEPKRCDGYNCKYRPVCHTDTLPHWSKDYSLKDIIVGQTKWSYEPEEYGEWSLHYGYLDSKPYWYSKGDQGEIHLKIIVGEVKQVWVCGVLGESLLHATFYLDPDAGDRLINYKPSENRKQWSSTKYVGNECKSINDLPVGTHVLSISTEKAKDSELQTAMSHVISWAN